MEGGFFVYVISKNTTELNNNLRNTALELARRNFHLLPLKPKSKAPYSELLPSNSWKVLKENKAGIQLVDSWFKYDKDINIGIITGVEVEKGYKLIVVDFDKKPKIALPITPIAETSRGYHVYFKCKENEIPQANKTENGEIKTNGYVVLAPSIHPSGTKYKWCEYLSFIDVPLADFKDRRTDIIKELNKKNKRNYTIKKESVEKDYTTINIYSSVVLKKYKNLSDDPEVNKDRFKLMIRDKDTVIQLMNKVFNVDVNRLEKGFLCPLHKENKPSTALYRTDSGDIGIKDFHRTGYFYTLPEFYFEYKTGKNKKLNSASWLIWLIRLLREGGLIELPRILPPKPLDKLTDNQKQLYAGFIELLEVQQGYDPYQQGAPFSHRFAAEWCNMNFNTVRAVKSSLMKKEYIKNIDMENRKKYKAAKWDLVR